MKDAESVSSGKTERLIIGGIFARRNVRTSIDKRERMQSRRINAREKRCPLCGQHPLKQLTE
jgi:hypothetical protein